MDKQTAQAILAAIEAGTFNPSAFRIFVNGAGQKVYIREEYETESSLSIRRPSHAWPYSLYKHAQTGKYRKQLAEKCRATLAVA